MNYTILSNFRTKYLVMCKVFTDVHVGGMKLLYHVCPPARKIIYSLKLVHYLHVQADSPWYNYNTSSITQLFCMQEVARSDLKDIHAFKEHHL